MEKPCFDDINEMPNEEILSRTLGEVKAAWDAFHDLLTESHPEFVREWRYYKDGHRWLYKITKKKKTICWVTVFHNLFKITFYFADKAEAFLLMSSLEKTAIEQFINGKRYGNIRAFTVEIEKSADLDAVKILIEIKERLK